MVKFTCEYCGKEASKDKNKIRATNYCSRACYYNSRVTTAKFNCEYCGIDTYKKPSHIKNRIFCSKECAGKWKSANICGENHHRYNSIMVHCVICGEVVYKCKSKLRSNNFCSRGCMGKWRSIYRSGANNHQYDISIKNIACATCNKLFRPVTRIQKFCSIECAYIGKRSQVIVECNNCGRNHSILIYNSKTYRTHFCSIKCKKEYQIGVNHPHYYSDRNMLKDKDHSIRHSPDMKAWRKMVYRRDDYTCQICNTRGGLLNAHHIVRYTDDVSLRFSIDNGITLCDMHHRSIMGKEKQYEEQFKLIVMSKKLGAKVAIEDNQLQFIFE